MHPTEEFLGYSRQQFNFLFKEIKIIENGMSWFVFAKPEDVFNLMDINYTEIKVQRC